MADTPPPAPDLLHHFPGLRLLKAFRIAIDIRKLMLAVAGVLVIAAGNVLLSLLPFAPSTEGFPLGMAIEHQIDGEFAAIRAPLLDAPLATAEGLLSPTPASIVALAIRWDVVMRPAQALLDPALDLFRPGLTWSRLAWDVSRLLWTLVVWAIVGGALTRMIAVQFARGDKISVGSALRFSLGKFLSFLGAPLLPISGIALLGGVCALVGLLGRIPEAGPAIVGVAWVVVLALGFLMTLMAIGAGTGWPLMYAAISAEGSDALDGFSRSNSFVYSRPWHYFGYLVAALAYGSVVTFFFSLVVSLTAYFAAWGVAAGMGTGPASSLHALAPGATGGPGLLGTETTTSVGLGTHFVSGWLFVASALVTGFVYSYFWTAATIIYFLLRHSDDASSFDEVWMPEEEEKDDLLPLVGVAASRQPVIERPVRPPPERSEAR